MSQDTVLFFAVTMSKFFSAKIIRRAATLQQILNKMTTISSSSLEWYLYKKNWWRQRLFCLLYCSRLITLQHYVTTVPILHS